MDHTLSYSTSLRERIKLCLSPLYILPIKHQVVDPLDSLMADWVFAPIPLKMNLQSEPRTHAKGKVIGGHPPKITPNSET